MRCHVMTMQTEPQLVEPHAGKSRRLFTSSRYVKADAGGSESFADTSTITHRQASPQRRLPKVVDAHALLFVSKVVDGIRRRGDQGFRGG